MEAIVPAGPAPIIAIFAISNFPVISKVGPPHTIPSLHQFLERW
jgi:hypothetical protein